MDKNKIAIATMTWARDEQEEKLMRESLTRLAQEEIPTCVADGGSGEKFLQFLNGLAGFHTLNAASSGVFSQVKKSLQAASASEADFILYTEPDKKLFFDGKLLDFLSEAPSGENIGIVLAARSAKSFATFPEFQQYTEAVINKLCAEVIGELHDYTYGPFLINRKLVTALNLAEHDLGWGWRPFLFATAQRRGYKIVELENDFPCPEEQQEDNEADRIYRMKQLVQHIDGLIAFTKTSEPNG